MCDRCGPKKTKKQKNKKTVVLFLPYSYSPVLSRKADLLLKKYGCVAPAYRIENFIVKL